VSHSTRYGAEFLSLLSPGGIIHLTLSRDACCFSSSPSANNTTAAALDVAQNFFAWKRSIGNVP
jgi:hypothetical protein